VWLFGTVVTPETAGTTTTAEITTEPQKCQWQAKTSVTADQQQQPRQQEHHGQQHEQERQQ
jgi:hypothetical protein